MITVATWNMNSVNARLPLLLKWLGEANPDVVLLQELKCQEEGFPFEPIRALGYGAEVVGQKSYNGVAILSRLPLEVTQRRLPTGDADGDEQARYIEAVIDNRLRVASLYLPNGNPAPGDKFDYKLAWMERLRLHAKNLLTLDLPVLLGGDYNICPTDADVWNPTLFRDDALCLPESRGKFREIVYQGWTDALATVVDSKNPALSYTYFDYQARAWESRHGLRIDHFLLSPQAADRLISTEIHQFVRSWERPSDHTPVFCTLNVT